jgi:hypothetical protein
MARIPCGNTKTAVHSTPVFLRKQVFIFLQMATGWQVFAGAVPRANRVEFLGSNPDEPP